MTQNAGQMLIKNTDKKHFLFISPLLLLLTHSSGSVSPISLDDENFKTLITPPHDDSLIKMVPLPHYDNLTQMTTSSHDVISHPFLLPFSVASSR